METKRFPILILLNIIVASLILPLSAYAFSAIIMVSNYCGSTFVVLFSFLMGTFLARISPDRSLENTLLLLTSLIFFQLFILELFIIKFKTMAVIEENIESSHNFIFLWKLVGVINSEGSMTI